MIANIDSLRDCRLDSLLRQVLIITVIRSLEIEVKFGRLFAFAALHRLRMMVQTCLVLFYDFPSSCVNSPKI